MKRLAVGLCVLALCGFECRDGGFFQVIAAFDNNMTFSFNGVDDDETPNCFEVSEVVDLSEYQQALAAAPGDLAKLEIISVIMTVRNITPSNTAVTITGNCSLALGDTGDSVDLGSYTFMVKDGEQISQNYDVDQVNRWLTQQIREHGKVTFNLVACMEPTAVAGFDTNVVLTGQVVSQVGGS